MGPGEGETGSTYCREDVTPEITTSQHFEVILHQPRGFTRALALASEAWRGTVHANDPCQLPPKLLDSPSARCC